MQAVICVIRIRLDAFQINGIPRHSRGMPLMSHHNVAEDAERLGEDGVRDEQLDLTVLGKFQECER